LIYNSTAQTIERADSTGDRSDKGHWLVVLGGTIADRANLEDPWTLLGGYEWRFADNWSMPLSFQMFRYDNASNILFGIDVALKARVTILRPMAGVYAQLGLGGIRPVLGIPLHCATGFEVGVFDRLALYGQVKKFINFEDGVFLSAGISINVTSARLRQRYDLE
jgi:hypothetical protein